MPRFSDKRNRRRHRSNTKSLATFPSNLSGEGATSQNHNLLDLSAEPFHFAPDLDIAKRRENKFSLLDQIGPNESCDSLPNSKSRSEDARCEEGENQIQSQEVHCKTGSVVQEGTHQGQVGSCRRPHKATQQSLNRVVVQPKEIALSKPVESSVWDLDDDTVAKGGPVGQLHGFRFGPVPDGSVASPHEALRPNTSSNHQQTFELGNLEESSSLGYKGLPNPVFACQNSSFQTDTERHSPAVQFSQPTNPAELEVPSTVFTLPSTTTQTTLDTSSAVKMSDNVSEPEQPPKLAQLVADSEPDYNDVKSIPLPRPIGPPFTKLRQFRSLPPPILYVCQAWSACANIYNSYDQLTGIRTLHDVYCDTSRCRLLPREKCGHLHRGPCTLRPAEIQLSQLDENPFPGLGASVPNMEQPTPPPHSPGLPRCDQSDLGIHAESVCRMLGLDTGLQRTVSDQNDEDLGDHASNVASERPVPSAAHQEQRLHDQASPIVGENSVSAARQSEKGDGTEGSEHGSDWINVESDSTTGESDVAEERSVLSASHQEQRLNNQASAVAQESPVPSAMGAVNDDETEGTEHESSWTFVETDSTSRESEWTVWEGDWATRESDFTTWEREWNAWDIRRVCC
ncbi:hypothetical protein IWX49DRAFT_558525 [Phyllosticta citricarpa]|uniref:Uncharacterized protein n=1 Tax=Phyllosticta citricarpa TaxID=55181 RepID=A0ABR1MQG9_9PEZI